MLGEPEVGVVLAQLQPELGPAGEHAIRLGDALGDQVVHQHAQVGLVPTGRPGGLVARLQRSIQTCEQTLCGRLLVSGRPVDLTGKEQASDRLGLEAGLQRTRVKVVVFDRVARSQDVRVLEAKHRVNGGQLNVKGQRGRDAVRIELVCGQPFRLEVDLVRRLVGKTIDLVLDARTVARPHPFDHAGEHRAAVETRADDLVSSLVGVRDPARDLRRMLRSFAKVAEHRHRCLRRAAVGARDPITELWRQPAEIDAASIEPRWCPGLQAALRQLQLLQPR